MTSSTERKTTDRRINIVKTSASRTSVRRELPAEAKTDLRDVERVHFRVDLAITLAHILCVKRHSLPVSFVRFVLVVIAIVIVVVIVIARNRLFSRNESRHVQSDARLRMQRIFSPLVFRLFSRISFASSSSSTR